MAYNELNCHAPTTPSRYTHAQTAHTVVVEVAVVVVHEPEVPAPHDAPVLAPQPEPPPQHAARRVGHAPVRAHACHMPYAICHMPYGVCIMQMARK
jgi:hypothetical protein